MGPGEVVVEIVQREGRLGNGGPRQERGPLLHELAPLLEQIGAPVGRLTPGRRLISNQFQSGGCEATKVGEIRCREARPIMDCCSRDEAVGE